MMHYYKQDEIQQHFSDFMSDCYGYLSEPEQAQLEPSDIHHEAFNTDYYIIGIWQAEQWLGKHAFRCIEIIKDYEQENFGQVTTDFSSPEAVVNMYTYIVGEQVVHDWFESEERA